MANANSGAADLGADKCNYHHHPENVCRYDLGAIFNSMQLPTPFKVLVQFPYSEGSEHIRIKCALD